MASSQFSGIHLLYEEVVEVNQSGVVFLTFLIEYSENSSKFFRSDVSRLRIIGQFTCSPHIRLRSSTTRSTEHS